MRHHLCTSFPLSIMNPQIHVSPLIGGVERSPVEKREYRISQEEAKARAWAVVRRLYRQEEGDTINPDRRARLNRRRSMLLRMQNLPTSRLSLR